MRKEKQKIRVSKKLKLILDQNKVGRETYEDVIWRIPYIKSFWGKAKGGNRK